MDILEVVQHIITYGLERFGLFYSTYYGYVVDTKDPHQVDRISVIIPEVLGKKSPAVAALPRNQYSGPGYGSHLLPKKGDQVIITFRHGNPSYPLWSFSNFQVDQIPEEFKEENVIGFVTPKGSKVIFKEGEADEEETILLQTPKGTKFFFTNDELTLETSHGVKLKLSEKAIEAGKQELHHLPKAEDTQAILKDLLDLIDNWSKTIIVDPGSHKNQVPFQNPATAVPLAKLKQDIENNITKYT